MQLKRYLGLYAVLWRNSVTRAMSFKGIAMKNPKLNRRVPIFAVCLLWGVMFSGLKIFAQDDSERKLIKLLPLSQEARQQLLDWNLKTLVPAYKQGGHTNAAWDTAAIAALTAYAHDRARMADTNGPWVETISDNCALAAHAGCDDPLLIYLGLRFAPVDRSNDSFRKFVSVATNLDTSPYPYIRKFYADFWALDQLNRVGSEVSPEVQPDRGQVLPMLIRNLEGALQDKSMPAYEAYEMADSTLKLFKKDKTNYKSAEEQWIHAFYENWGDDYTAYLLKGKIYVDLAWFARGSGYADTVTEQGWKEFNEDLKIARESLEHAWLLNPKDIEISHTMMDVVLGQAPEAKDMEIWFDRAMEIDTNDMVACRDRLYYLEPKWNGSDEQQIAFGRWCATSKKWGGEVPLILLEAHTAVNKRNPKEMQADYWKRPEVWADVQTAIRRYRELNPDKPQIYQVYAAYAYKAEQWDVLNELIPKILHQPINFAFFGGEDNLHKMMLAARQHATKK